MIHFDTSAITVSLDVAAALIAFAGKDETRPHVGVGVDQTSLAATDGHRLVLFTDNGANAQAFGKPYQGRVWPRAHVETLVKVAKAQKRGEIQLELDKAQPGFARAWRVVPDYGMEPRADRSIGLDPAYLSDLGKVTRACAANGVELSQVKGELDPVGLMVSGVQHTARIVIMPMRK